MVNKVVTRFQFRRGTKEKWEKNNPVLANGEPGVVIGENLLKIGDGKTPWKELKPINDTQKGNNKSFSESVFVSGDNNLVGLKGYYYDKNSVKIPTNREKVEITLSTSQSELIAPVGEIGWKLNDKVTIVNDSHYDQCSTIVGINGNVITLDKVPFSTIKNITEPNWEDYSIFVVSKPETGAVDLGRYSAAIGEDNTVSERAAVAIGKDNIVQGKYGVALGRLNAVKAYAGVAIGRGNTIESTALYADALGLENVVSGVAGYAEGSNNKAIGNISHAEGYRTEASGGYSHSQGCETIASGLYAYAEGFTTVSSGESSHAEGSYSAASGENSHAEGYRTKASGDNSHAEGNQSVASGLYAHAEGEKTEASGDKSHAEGQETSALGIAAHAEGRIAIAEGAYSHAEGQGTKATGGASHAEGNSTEATGGYAHAEGDLSKASGAYSHAEGRETSASGAGSHSQGRLTTASGDYSHAGGYNTTASGQGSTTFGIDTVAESRASLASGLGVKAIRSNSAWFGQYNDPKSNHIFGIGIGINDTNRGNAFAIDTSGNSNFFGHRAQNVADAVAVTDAVNLKQLNERTIDYIISQGTSGIWTYRKWNSGIAECWGKWTVTGMEGEFPYITTYMQLPLNFVEMQTVTATANSDYLDPVPLLSITTASSGKNLEVYTYFPHSAPKEGELVHGYIHVIGRWK